MLLHRLLLEPNPATIVFMSLRPSPEPSQSPVSAEADPQRAPGDENTASSLFLPVWRCFPLPSSSRRRDLGTFSGPVERKEKLTVAELTPVLVGAVGSGFFFLLLNNHVSTKVHLYFHFSDSVCCRLQPFVMSQELQHDVGKSF